MDEPLRYDKGTKDGHAVMRELTYEPRDGEAGGGGSAVVVHETHDGSRPGAPEWRREIEAQCGAWLDFLEGTPPAGDSELKPEAASKIPDIYSFYAELCAVRHEFRKQSRRTTDGLSRFGGILDEFEEVFSRLLARLDRANEPERAIFLPLVDLYDRFQRLEKRLADPPPMGFFGGRRRRQTWTGIRDGFAILRDHFAALLRQEGVEALVTVGQPFDPRSMKALEVEETDAVPADEVLAELTPGYSYRGQVLRLAEVKVAKKKTKET